MPDSSDKNDEIPAATLVIFRRSSDGGPPELLMVERAEEMVFAGGAAVFPGGRVDPADRELAGRLDHGLGDDDEAAHRIAAIRETLEETGLALGLEGQIDAQSAAAARKQLIETGALAPVLETFGLQLAFDKLVPFARWCPRGFRHSRIFDTRFYLADLGTGNVEIAIDETENTQLFWVSAQEALNRADSGAISIIFPTRRNLERLAQFADFDEAHMHSLRHPIHTIAPQVETRGGVTGLTIPQDAGYPVTFEPIENIRRA